MTASVWWKSNSRMVWNIKWIVGLWALLPTLAIEDIAAAELWKESFQIHGFASQAFILTSDNNFFGKSEDNGTFDFRELGINSSFRPIPELLASVQLLSRRAGESDDGDVRLDYGLLDYNIISELDYSWGVRLGRIINPIGLYNDTRDVAFTRPSILLPQSIYFDRNRDLALSSNGGQIYGEIRTELGDFQFQLNTGFPRTEESVVERSILGRDFPGDLEGDISILGRLLYEKDGGKIRLGLSGGQVNVDYDAAGREDPLQDGSFKFSPLILSAQYNAEHWSLTGEYALRHFAFEGLGPRFRLPKKDFTGESYYLQGTYRFSPTWEGMVRYDVLFTDRDDRDGEEFEAATGLPSHTRFAKDFTLGLRWDITPSFMFRAEYHNVNGTGWLTLEDNPNILATEQHWDLFTLLLSYRF